jgi:hypothetical protein
MTEQDSQTVVVEITTKKLGELMLKSIESVFTSSYDNPLKKAMEQSIRDQEGKLKKFIDGIIDEAISDPEFKTKIAGEVMKRMIENALKR